MLLLFDERGEAAARCGDAAFAGRTLAPAGFTRVDLPATALSELVDLPEAADLRAALPPGLSALRLPLPAPDFVAFFAIEFSCSVVSLA
jgi:hypothetical protein